MGLEKLSDYHTSTYQSTSAYLADAVYLQYPSTIKPLITHDNWASGLKVI